MTYLAGRNKEASGGKVRVQDGLAEGGGTIGGILGGEECSHLGHSFVLRVGKGGVGISLERGSHVEKRGKKRGKWEGKSESRRAHVRTKGRLINN